MEINGHQVVWVVIYHGVDDDFIESCEEDTGQKPDFSLECTNLGIAVYSTYRGAKEYAEYLMADNENFEEYDDDYWTLPACTSGTDESVRIQKEIVL